jgi:hypothetical protein
VNPTRFSHGAFDALSDGVVSMLGSFRLIDFETLQRRVLLPCAATCWWGRCRARWAAFAFWFLGVRAALL